MSATEQPRETATRAGYVTLVGRPNVGKSTLLNRMVGQHLSIVTPKAQTTWQRVTGVLTLEDAQLVFLDTPGLLETGDLLQRSMLNAALKALREADVVLLVLDATRPPREGELDRISSSLAGIRAPLHVALNKIDRARTDAVDAWTEWVAHHGATDLHRLSALEGEGVPELLEAIRKDLPASPYLYPSDQIASDPVRFFVAELVRETIFERYHQEIPYSVFCRVEEFREEQDPLYIHVDIYVERSSQKAIIIGARGAAIRELGQRSRTKIEHFLDRPVYLDLWVKPLGAWRRSRAHLRQFGFRIPEDDDALDS